MSVNRVQKLLFSEYCDFEDMVLIESPFAQTTKEGKGIRQVHIGITPSKLVLATDILPPVEFGTCKYTPGVDPEIETFELIAIYPVECVNLSVYRRKQRQALKARFCNNKVLYFELGGFEKRGMFWNLWCEKVKFLCPGDTASSRSETSVATSTTGSTLYLLDKKLVAVNGMKQLWCKFGPNAVFDSNLISDVIDGRIGACTWGKNFNDLPLEYKPVVDRPTADDFLLRKSNPSSNAGKNRGFFRAGKNYVSRKKSSPYFQEKGLNISDTVQINRFGSGVNEGCGTGLYLTVDDYVIPHRYSQTFSVNEISDHDLPVNYPQLAENAVLIWEFYRATDPNKYNPLPALLMRVWAVECATGFSVFRTGQRAASEVNIRSQPLEPGLRLPVSKKQLVATVSCHFLGNKTNSKSNSIINAPRRPVIYFWTPDYWYRPKSAKDSYEGVAETHEKDSRLPRGSFKKRRDTDEESTDERYFKRNRKRKQGFIHSMFGTRAQEISDLDPQRQPQESPMAYIKRTLKADLTVTAWDFDSTTLAEQLTMIDKELFLKISSDELATLVWQQSAKNTPNVSAVIAFSHRISCLIASEVLKDESERARARLMARFINVADKCHRISNFQSCRTVLSGLQSPAMYRLRRTWAYIRKKHASKYQVTIFEHLCRLYRDPRMPTYQKTFYIMSKNTPFLPYIGDIIAKLLNKIPEYQIQTFRRPISRQSSI
ncbi:hypothetical protein NQ318_004172, partial [Aromia moschata]